MDYFRIDQNFSYIRKTKSLDLHGLPSVVVIVITMVNLTYMEELAISSALYAEGQLRIFTHLLTM